MRRAVVVQVIVLEEMCEERGKNLAELEAKAKMLEEGTHTSLREQGPGLKAISRRVAQRAPPCLRFAPLRSAPLCESSEEEHLLTHPRGQEERQRRQPRPR